MFSRASAKLLGELYADLFASKRRHDLSFGIDPDRLYDFFYERDYDRGFLDLVKTEDFNRPRHLAEFIMGIHTGESFTLMSMPGMNADKRGEFAQLFLLKLAEDILRYCEGFRFGLPSDKISKLRSQLELDGFIWNPESKKLIRSEEGVLDVMEEQSLLLALASQLSLKNPNLISHHLSLSEEQYINDKWSDSISNSRKVLESVYQEVAARHYELVKGSSIPTNVYEKAGNVRDYLAKNGLINNEEKEAISKIYGLLSDTGGHPYIAEKDQARLMRHLSLTLSQFILFRLKGYLEQKR